MAPEVNEMRSRSIDPENPPRISTEFADGSWRIPEEYRDSYNWLLIGLCIGQRVSDLLKLSPNNLRKAPTRLYIDILQQKTKKADPLVIKLLENEFPRRVS